MASPPVIAQPSVDGPSEVYATFCDQISQLSAQRIMQGVSTAMAAQVKHVHLLFQSTGGFIGDGICLYNFFRALPIDLTIYNCGSVQSAACTAYLGAKRRKVSTYAAFMFHRATFAPQSANSQGLKSAAQVLSVEEQRNETILRDMVRFSEDQWKIIDVGDLIVAAEEAVRIGIAQEIGEFCPPPGTKIFTV